MNPWTLSGDIMQSARRILGTKLHGFYVHGSLAFGDFDPLRSDIDILIVVNRAPTELENIGVINLMLEKTPLAPAKGLEMSVVRLENTLAPAYPPEFDLHFSNMHIESARADKTAYVRRMRGEDPDLAAHFAMTREAGVALWGPPANETFGEVSRQAMLKSILCDVMDAESEIERNPIYITLNLCRALAYAREGRLLSKRAGGEWAKANLTGEYARFALNALNAHISSSKMSIDARAARDFARRMLSEINRLS